MEYIYSPFLNKLNELEGNKRKNKIKINEVLDLFEQFDYFPDA